MILAFLIADIRGYTRFTQVNGDEAAGRLAGQFAALTREVVTAHDGTLLELRGDEALVVFDSPRQAVRAAVALQQRYVEEVRRTPELPLTVGIGVDVGEVVAVEGGYRGRALNLAARLCSAAKAGEVLVSAQAVHLGGRVVDFRYVPRPAFAVKGVDEPVTAVQVMPRDSDPAQELKDLRALPPPPPRVSRWASTRLRVLAALAAAALVSGLGVGIERWRSGPQTYPVGTVFLTADGAEQVAHIPPAQLKAPGFPLYDGRHFWVANAGPDSFAEIDARTGRIVQQFANPVSVVNDEVQGYQTYDVVDGALWLASGHGLVKIDVELGRQVDRLDLDKLVGTRGLTEGVTHGGGLLWVSRDAGVGEVVGIDVAASKVVTVVHDVRHHSDIAYGDGVIWAADTNAVDVIDLSTAEVTTVGGIDASSRFVQSGGGYGWTSEPSKGVVYKIDRHGQLRATYRTGLGAGALSYSDGVAWVANNDEGTVSGIDVTTGEVTTHELGHPTGVVAAGGGHLLVWLLPGRPVDETVAQLKGEVLRLFAQQGEFGEGEEPLYNGSDAAQQIKYATCATLLNHPDRAGAAGAALVPEVAVAMPALSADRRTYTFTIRPGFRFSPPSNRPLTAETFRYSIERALSPKMGESALAQYVVDDIAGEAAYREGKAPHISGLRADGPRLSVTLTEPSADFLERISLPYFCPVPEGTAFLPGAPVKGGDPLAGGGTIPSAGPYYIASLFNEQLLLLRRNPNYRGSRPHALDAIALREGVDAGVAVERVLRGEYDGIVSSGHNGSSRYATDLAPGGVVASRFRDGGSGKPSYLLPTLPGVGFLALDTVHGPLRDPVVRAALVAATDRAELARIWGQLPSTDPLPPLLRRGVPEAAGPVPGPDPVRARQLMRGRHVRLTMAAFPWCTECVREAAQLRAELRPAGFDLRIQSFDDYGAAIAPGSGVDLVDSGASIGYPDAASFLAAMLDQGVPEGWLPTTASQLADGLAQTPTGRLAAAVSAASTITRSSWVLPYGNHVQPELLGPRMGCRVFTPVSFGVDLAALCRSG